MNNRKRNTKYSNEILTERKSWHHHEKRKKQIGNKINRVKGNNTAYEHEKKNCLQNSAKIPVSILVFFVSDCCSVPLIPNMRVSA